VTDYSTVAFVEDERYHRKHNSNSITSLAPPTLLTFIHQMMVANTNKKAVLSQGNRAMPQLFFSVESSPTTFITS